VDSSEPADDELIRRHRAGDPIAFPALHERHKRAVYGYIRSLVVDEHAANDVFQETWTKVFSAVAPRGSYKEEKNRFRPWLFRIAHNEWIGHVRSIGHGLQTPGDEEDGGLALEIPSREPPPDQPPIDAEVWQAVLDCMHECLDEEQRAAFILVVMEGLKYKEAAVVLEVPGGTVASRVGRARADLRECLRRKGIEP
jgi:RNA polymerase sigma-70 factor (ECF subfamily)